MFFHIGFVFAKPFLNSCQICHFRLRCHSLNLKTATYLQAGDERVRCSSQIGHWTKSNSQKIFDWNKIERSIFELNCNRLLQQAIFPDLGSKMLLKFAFFFFKICRFQILAHFPILSHLRFCQNRQLTICLFCCLIWFFLPELWWIHAKFYSRKSLNHRHACFVTLF